MHAANAGKTIIELKQDSLYHHVSVTHHIGWESHLGRRHQHRADRPSIVDCVSLNYYQRAVSKSRSLSPATLAAIDSPLISQRCPLFLRFSFFQRCSCDGVTRFFFVRSCCWCDAIVKTNETRRKKKNGNDI